MKGFVSQCKICNNGWENVNGICVKVVWFCFDWKDDFKVNEWMNHCLGIFILLSILLRMFYLSFSKSTGVWILGLSSNSESIPEQSSSDSQLGRRSLLGIVIPFSDFFQSILVGLTSIYLVFSIFFSTTVYFAFTYFCFSTIFFLPITESTTFCCFSL